LQLTAFKRHIDENLTLEIKCKPQFKELGHELEKGLDVSCFTTCSIESYKQFSPLRINHVLFTKLDEGLN
jgi:hypothetical protein